MSSFTSYSLFCILVIAAGGIPKGYDEGGFSASVGLPSFKADYNLIAKNWSGNASGLASRQANISSFGVLGAAFGSLIAIAVNDRLGRLRSWQFFMVLWAGGILMQVFSSGVFGFLLFARIWGGLGSGGLTVVAPLFLSEIAPTKRRGLVVSMYMVVLLSFLTIGFFINYGANKGLDATRTQYRLVQAIPLIPCGIAFISSFFLEDSPKWLASKDRSHDAIRVLAKLRGSKVHDEINGEVEAIQSQLAEQHATLADASFQDICREIITIPSYRKRFILALLMQTVAQWSGGNGITYYVPQIFTYAGVKGENLSLITSGSYGIVKLVFTMIFAWGLVDFFGRRRSMITGISLQLIAHIYMSIYMSALYDDHNKSASDAAIAAVFIYAVGWSIGLCTVQYLYGTEIFPTRIRAVCYAVNMAVHWFFQFAVVRVTPSMFVAFHVWGAFAFWAGVCAIGLIVLGLMAPETKQVPMEQMEELFAGPWYMGWRGRTSPEQGETLQLDLDSEKMASEQSSRLK